MNKVSHKSTLKLQKNLTNLPKKFCKSPPGRISKKSFLNICNPLNETMALKSKFRTKLQKVYTVKLGYNEQLGTSQNRSL